MTHRFQDADFADFASSPAADHHADWTDYALSTIAGWIGKNGRRSRPSDMDLTREGMQPGEAVTAVSMLPMIPARLIMAYMDDQFGPGYGDYSSGHFDALEWMRVTNRIHGFVPSDETKSAVDADYDALRHYWAHNPDQGPADWSVMCDAGKSGVR